MPDKNPQSIYTLAPLGYFDPAAFTSLDKEEQKVCSFVLTLALVYNDFCDLLWVFDLHLKNPPDSKGSSKNNLNSSSILSILYV